MEHQVSVDVDAAPEQIWPVLVDVEGWPEWSESMTKVELLTDEPLAVGSRVRIKQPRLATATWEVTSLEPSRQFDWVTSAPGVTTTATHRIEPSGDGTSVVHIGVRQTGPLAGLTGVLFGRMTRKYVQIEAEGLRRQAESGS